MKRIQMLSLVTLCGVLAIGGTASAAPAASAAPSAPGDPTPRLEVRIEGGLAWQTRNEAQIPNDASGTRFSIVDVIGRGPFPAGRAYATWNANERHGFRLLLAPLTISENGTLAAPAQFAGESFAAGPVQATYRFNSWRATYRYRFRSGGTASWWIGFTAKVRDAKIELDQDGATARKNDLGFVPLLHLAGTFRLAERWSLAFDLDALAGGPGRAEDAALTFGYAIADRVRLSAGYRTVEGGADVDSVYTFAWLHYAVVSAEVGF